VGRTRSRTRREGKRIPGENATPKPPRRPRRRRYRPFASRGRGAGDVVVMVDSRGCGFDDEQDPIGERDRCFRADVTFESRASDPSAASPRRAAAEADRGDCTPASPPIGSRVTRSPDLARSERSARSARNPRARPVGPADCPPARCRRSPRSASQEEDGTASWSSRSPPVALDRGPPGSRRHTIAASKGELLSVRGHSLCRGYGGSTRRPRPPHRARTRAAGAESRSAHEPRTGRRPRPVERHGAADGGDHREIGAVQPWPRRPAASAPESGRPRSSIGPPFRFGPPRERRNGAPGSVESDQYWGCAPRRAASTSFAGMTRIRVRGSATSDVRALTRWRLPCRPLGLCGQPSTALGWGDCYRM
jgi:hypothetical protein